MKIEIRNGNEVHIRGYVNAVERDSRVLPAQMAQEATGEFVEQIAAGAFSRALRRNSDVKLCYNHERVIGGMSSGELTLQEDNIGLLADAVIKDNEVVTAATRGELRGWSFGFSDPKSEWSEDKHRRKLTDFDLREVSILTKTPAYIGTSVELRGDDVSVICKRGFEDTAEVTTINTQDKDNTAGIPNYRAVLDVLKLKNKN